MNFVGSSIVAFVVMIVCIAVIWARWYVRMSVRNNAAIQSKVQLWTCPNCNKHFDSKALVACYPRNATMLDSAGAVHVPFAAVICASCQMTSVWDTDGQNVFGDDELPPS